MGRNLFINQQVARNFCNLCNRCLFTETEDSKILSEIAHSDDRDAKHLLREIEDSMPGLREKTSKWTQKRLEEEREMLIDKVTERIARDDMRKEVEKQIRELKYEPEEEIIRQDLEECLKDYIKQGYLDWEEEEIRITSKGAKILASEALNRILKKIAAREVGPHSFQQIDYGTDLAISSRKYEPGDEYHKIDFEKTFLNALERDLAQKKISLQPEDFQIYDEIRETRMCAGLIIDESASMRGEKTDAAIDTALALAELIRREPRDMLKVYLFSSQVREIPYYNIVNVSFSGDTTDIRAALKAFRKRVSNEKGDKQAYLITDTEANTEDGRAVGFKEATLGVIREALRYRQAGITLNIIMLDQSPRLKEVASILAKRNLGMVIFTSPQKLGEIVIEDYLTSKKKSH